MTNKKNKQFLKLPTYPGGSIALKEFIAAHLQYPEEANKNNIQGVVYISYEVDDYGTVLSASVLKGLGYGCDEEGLRIVKMLKYEKVKNAGQHVKVTMKIKIYFQPPQPVITNNYQYNYTETNASNTDQQTVYTYTITIDSPNKNE